MQQRRSLLQLVLAGLFGTCLHSALGPPRAGAGPLRLPDCDRPGPDAASALFQAPPCSPRPFADLSCDQYAPSGFPEDRRLFGDGAGFQMDPAHRPGQSPSSGAGSPARWLLDRLFRLRAPVFPLSRRPRSIRARRRARFTGLRLRASINRPGLGRGRGLSGASYFGPIPRHALLRALGAGPAIRDRRADAESFPSSPPSGSRSRCRRLPASSSGPLLDGLSVAGAYQIEISPGSAMAMGGPAGPSFPAARSLNAGIAPLDLDAPFRPREPGRDRRFPQRRPAIAKGSGSSAPRGTALEAPSEPGGGGGLWPSGRTIPATSAGSSETGIWLVPGPEARYELRAERPGRAGLAGGTGRSCSELLTGNEFSDNVVAFWRARGPARGGQRAALRLQPDPGPLPGRRRRSPGSWRPAAGAPGTRRSGSSSSTSSSA